MKFIDPLSQMQKKLALFVGKCWKKSGKTEKRVNFFYDPSDGQVSFFQKWYTEMSSGFLRCNQCIKTVLLSYQNNYRTIFLIFHPKGSYSVEGVLSTGPTLSSFV